MKINIPYWGEELNISLPKQNVGEIVYPNTVELRPEKEVISEALKNPLNSPSFENFIKGNEPILFIINDATRPTPNAKIIDLLWSKIKNKDIKFIIATGAHRGASKDEYIELFGNHYSELLNKTISHDAKNESENIFIGKTQNGTEVYFDKLVFKAKKIVYITSVEPHYFAGYTGGAKSFLPGIAGFKTIEQNHALALKSTAKALITDGNPVREDIKEAYDLLAKNKQIFSIQTVLNKDHKIYYCVCGETHEAFNMATGKAKDVFSVEIKDKADIVVAVAPYPMDIDLYQSQKAIDNSKLALNENGIMILISSCRKGVGGETFLKLMSSARNPDDVFDKISKGYKLGYHKAAKLAEIMKWASLWAYTKLDPKLLENIFIKGYWNLQKAIDRALEIKGNEKIMFLMDASMTVPRVAPRILHKNKYIYSPTSEKIKSKKSINFDAFFDD
ncbi:MAG TPA: nickel-dependent lactate racemase [Candidatus Cloacimonetes bacterium]|nr:nickel-dependent lactate racemase [Candidatus Cloacimonadota bacterium]